MDRRRTKTELLLAALRDALEEHEAMLNAMRGQKCVTIFVNYRNSGLPEDVVVRVDGQSRVLQGPRAKVTID